MRDPIKPPPDLAERVGILARWLKVNEEEFVGYVARPEEYKPFDHPTKCSLEQLAYYYDNEAKFMPKEYRERFHAKKKPKENKR